MDSSSASLGSVNATAAGEGALLQTVAVATSGTYSINVTSLAGTGAYGIRVALNAAVEEERLLGTSNNTIGTAQAIGASSVALTDTAYRLAVLGGGDTYLGSVTTGVSLPRREE